MKTSVGLPPLVYCAVTPVPALFVKLTARPPRDHVLDWIVNPMLLPALSVISMVGVTAWLPADPPVVDCEAENELSATVAGVGMVLPVADALKVFPACQTTPFRASWMSWAVTCVLLPRVTVNSPVAPPTL